MKKIKLLFLIIASLFIACSDYKEPPTRRGQMEKLGIFGQHNLRRIEQTMRLSGSLSGTFFLGGSGSISGNIDGGKNLQFFWGRTSEEFISTTVPYSHFRFIIDETKTIPTAEFIFSESWLDQKRDLPEAAKANLNSFLNDWMIKSYSLNVIVVKISKKALEKEIYVL